MKITLISTTNEPEKTVAAAAWGCTHSEPRLPSDFTFQEACGIIERVLGYGHTSIAEHASYTFLIQGISRITSHQLVRQRIASFSQQSQRYCGATLEGGVIPDSVTEAGLGWTFDRMLSEIEFFYENLVDAGVPEEDARYIMPGAAPTSITVTMNARSLRRFLTDRLCKRAQWEIRGMAQGMLDLLDGPLFAGVGPTCAICAEKRCG